jgi:hypothetical protein
MKGTYHIGLGGQGKGIQFFLNEKESSGELRRGVLLYPKKQC